MLPGEWLSVCGSQGIGVGGCSLGGVGSLCGPHRLLACTGKKVTLISVCGSLRGVCRSYLGQRTSFHLHVCVAHLGEGTQL